MGPADPKHVAQMPRDLNVSPWEAWEEQGGEGVSALGRVRAVPVTLTVSLQSSFLF